MDLKNLSSNWKKLQETLKKDPVSTSTKRKTSDRDVQHGVVKKRKSEAVDGKKKFESTRISKKRKRMADGSDGGENGVQETAGKSASRRNSTAAESRTAKVNEGRSPTAELGKFVAMDCEMVGVGPNPDNDSALARVSIVNFNGDQVYDSYVRPKEMVTDWRTHVSGITPKNMVEARSLEQVQKDVTSILDGRILVGHALSNDFYALLLSHPKRDVRDTSKHPPYRKLAGGGSPRLKMLASEYLGLDIQKGAHSSVEDARATMMLYRRDKDAFEREHLKKWPLRVVAEKADKEEGEEQKKKKKKKKKTRKRAMFAIQSQPRSGSETEKTANTCTPNILPCRIHHDGPVRSLKRYWEPVSDEKDENLQTAYFRGRKLRGRRVAIPEGYEGVVAMPTERVLPATRKETDDEDAEPEEPIKIIEKQATFDEFMVWDHEVVPAADDTYIKGVEEWVKLAQLMHSAPESEKKEST
ncbi:putative 3'-5' exonuclease [Aspergillus affinis]|uniref:putative 3'-5' exonuclease n=1 Tax=Aspergillus affinis TaxID=1070780 RepID=UPI0022FE824C|nr:uncharacterized protein KD926_010379 [Aspergillus affinis]KAI9045056.1 hypothetical protein KD926_010379 [Aspergillus affinis]